MARILDGYDREAIREAASIIQNGGVVAFPTETVHGLGADAFNPKAVALIFELKNRPRFDPLIVHIAELSDVGRICLRADDRAVKLMERFWPGPLTLVLPKTPEVPDIVTAGLPTVAVRLPSHPVALSLIRGCGTPIAAPSANPFGYLSPTTAEHVNEQLGNRIEIILDGGPCPVGVESTIIGLFEAEPLLLRPGGTPLEEIEMVIGRVKIESRVTRQQSAVSSQQSGVGRGTIDYRLSAIDSRLRSPGQLPHHYSPRTPLRLLPDGEAGNESRLSSQQSAVGGGEGDYRLSTIDYRLINRMRIGLLAFCRPQKGDFAAIEVLSPSGDLQEAAANLFAALHRLDSAGLDFILVERVPEEGLGRAIMDRLRRAEGR